MLDNGVLASVMTAPCHDMSRVSIHWHVEKDYNSIEIPCPTYTRGPFSKKFSKFLINV